jgi:CheY-like chemotaxis protein
VGLKGRSVLVVDDDEAQREVLIEILEMEGVLTFPASTASEAIRLLDKEPDIVLMDLRGVDVNPVKEALEGRPKRPALIIVSGDVRLSQHARELGADAWLAKPYELDQLLDMLGEVLTKGAGALGPPPA